MNSDLKYPNNSWALILGASSGFGAAISKELARCGMNIVGVHFDRSTTLSLAESVKKSIIDEGVRALFYNINAADEVKRKEVLDEIQEIFKEDKNAGIRVLLHSLAFGTIRPLISEDPGNMMSQRQMEMTLDVMANSLVYWVQGSFSRKLLKRGSRILAMTSSGGHSVLLNYGAVSAAKAAIESHIRQLAMELGPYGITANSLMAGVTDTPALKKIPGAMKMLEIAKAKNPQMKTTTPEDVAKAVALLAHENAYFISGNVIGVDGGEDIVNYIGQKNVLELE